jgi:hypothetical protein
MGKPKQEAGISGGKVHAHTRGPRLASLSNEALEALAHAYDDVLARHSPAALDAVLDRPQNQIESSHALQPPPVESEATYSASVDSAHLRSATLVRK